MHVKLFLEYLPWLRKPEYFYLSKRVDSGWTADDVRSALEQQKREFNLLKHRNSIDRSILPTDLQDFYADYDLSNIHLLWTSFWSEPRRLEQGWGFADMSETNIVMTPSGRVEAYHAHPIRGMPGAADCLGVLAKDLGSYLEAMLYGAFNAHHFIPGTPAEDPILYQKTVLVAKHCALIAGGYEYYDFWAGILGLPYTDKVPD